MQINRTKWDKNKHGLVWQISDVFREHELDYIKERIPRFKIQVPEGQPPTAYRAAELPLIKDSFEPILSWLYPQLVEEMKEEGVKMWAEKHQQPLTNPVLDISLQGTAQGINYKIHTDVPQKYLSFLVYIHPVRQEPTYFHAFEKGLENKFKEEDTNPYEVVPWKINTGYIFLANDLSLHSYGNTVYDTDRYVVLGNLINEV